MTTPKTVFVVCLVTILLAGCDSATVVLSEANATTVTASLWPAPAADAHDGHVYEYH